MNDVFGKLFEFRLYVRVSKDRFDITPVSDAAATEAFSPATPFTSARLLVGEFSVAQECLRRGLSKMAPKGLFKGSPAVLIHPVDMIDGGLSEVERRVFQELAFAAGARRAVIWVGDELTLEQVNVKLEGPSE